MNSIRFDKIILITGHKDKHQKYLDWLNNNNFRFDTIPAPNELCSSLDEETAIILLSDKIPIDRILSYMDERKVTLALENKPANCELTQLILLSEGKVDRKLHKFMMDGVIDVIYINDVEESIFVGKMHRYLNFVDSTLQNMQFIQDKIDNEIHARRIQDALMPRNLTILTDFFADWMLSIKSKHILSGDFYWFHRSQDKLIFIMGDCTGHGTSAAMLTLMAITIIEKIVIERKITYPGSILSLIDSEFNRIFIENNNFSATEILDGMDASIIIYDPINLSIEYATAMRSILLVRNNEEIILKGDRIPISGGNIYGVKIFTTHKLTLQKEDILYLYSDGFTDQLGAFSGKKLSAKRFREILMEICDMPLSEQKEILDEVMDAWQGENSQTDDISIFAFRV